MTQDRFVVLVKDLKTEEFAVGFTSTQKNLAEDWMQTQMNIWEEDRAYRVCTEFEAIQFMNSLL